MVIQQLMCVSMENAQISRLFGLREDGRHCMFSVVLKNGQTDGRTDGWMHRWMNGGGGSGRGAVECNRRRECGAKP